MSNRVELINKTIKTLQDEIILTGNRIGFELQKISKTHNPELESLLKYHANLITEVEEYKKEIASIEKKENLEAFKKHQIDKPSKLKRYFENVRCANVKKKGTHILADINLDTINFVTKEYAISRSTEIGQKAVQTAQKETSEKCTRCPSTFIGRKLGICVTSDCVVKNEVGKELQMID